MTGLAASAPLRVDLAGGTLDLWPLHVLHPDSCTVNVALRLRARATFRPGARGLRLQAKDLDARRRLALGRLDRAARDVRDGDPFGLALQALSHVGWTAAGALDTQVEGPPGGGLAGSSALLVALLGLATRGAGRRFDRLHAPEVARDLEARLLGLPTGVQDYYPALFGGALSLTYEPGAVRMARLPLDADALEARVILAYSGKPHASAPSNWSIYRRRLEGDSVAERAFTAIAAAGRLAARALGSNDWRGLGEAMSADWAARKELEPALAPADLRRLEEAGLEAGARAAKCCGAASGGTMLFLLRAPGQRQAVERALRDAGARIVPFQVARSGLLVRRLGA